MEVVAAPSPAAPRRRRHVCLGLLALLGCLLAARPAPAADGAPLRLLLAPVAMSTDPPDRMSGAEQLSRTLGLFLEERLAEAPGVMLVDPQRADALLFGLRQVQELPPDQWLAALQPRLDLDAIVFARVHPGAAPTAAPTAELLVATAAGLQRVDLGTEADPARLRQAVTALADSLRLSPADRAPLLDKRLPDKALCTLYLSRRLNTVWIYNRGEHQLELIRPWLAEANTNPDIARFFLDAASAAHDDKRKIDNPRRIIDMCRGPLRSYLGSEAAARDAVYRPLAFAAAAYQAELLEWAAPLGRDAADAMLDLALDDPDADAALPTRPVADARPIPLSLRCDAVRLLAGNPAARPLIDSLVGHPDLAVREAAVEALTLYADAAAIATCTRLAQGDVPSVGLLAIAGLRAAAAPYAAADAVRHAAACLQHPRYGRRAHLLLIAHADAARADWLRSVTVHPFEPVRAVATSRLHELGQLSGPALLQALRDPAASVVVAGLLALRDGVPDDPALRALLLALANSPHAPIADRATVPVRAYAADDSGIALRIGSLYRRLQAVDARAAAGTPAARQALAAAITPGQHPQVAAAAFLALAAQDPGAARDCLPVLAAQRNLWVRLQLAAWLADHADAADAAVLAQLQADEPDAAVAIYLARAAARLTGGAVTAPPATNPIRGFGICGLGLYAADSPLTWHYILNPGPESNDQARALHATGRAFIGRANRTVKHPGHAFFHPAWQHTWYRALVDELGPLDWLDGVVLGEESMYFRPWQLWELGWWDFCGDIGLDPATVDGEREQLTPTQKQAYLHWEQERSVEGFNRMYGFVKCYFGALRPGYQVVTFMPHQNGPGVADARWQFDMGAAYYYEAGNRVRYNLIRRQKTLWPERPVLWLVNGSAGTAGPNFGRELLKYDAPMPASPIGYTDMRAYSDAVTARLAGAEVGYFSIWLAANMRQSGQDATGTWLHLQDITPASPVLAEAQRTAFGGVEAFLRAEADTTTLKQGMNAEAAMDAGDGEALGLALEDPDPEAHPTRRKLRALETRWRQGMLMEQRLLYDVARVVGDLPAPPVRPRVLWIGPNQGDDYDITPSYDYLQRLNALADIDLGRYELIGIVGQDETRLQDATLAALSDWLATTRGVLYIRGSLATDDALEAATPDDLDGRLQRDWPWETLTLGPATDGIAQYPGLPVLVAAATPVPDALRARINALLAAGGHDLRLDGPSGIIRGSVTESQIAAAAGATGIHAGDDAPVTFSATAGKVQPIEPQVGVDLLSGRRDPVIGPGRMAAITAPPAGLGLVGAGHLQVIGPLRILADRPLGAISAQAMGGGTGLRIETPGLLQLNAVDGLTIRGADAAPLPEIDPAAGLAWLLESDAPGVLRLERDGHAVFYVRSPAAITLGIPR